MNLDELYQKAIEDLDRNLGNIAEKDQYTYLAGLGYIAFKTLASDNKELTLEGLKNLITEIKEE